MLKIHSIFFHTCGKLLLDFSKITSDLSVYAPDFVEKNKLAALKVKELKIISIDTKNYFRGYKNKITFSTNENIVKNHIQKQ